MNNEEEENYYPCQYCGAMYDSEDERDNHIFEKHMDAVEQKLSEMRNIAESNRETITSWKDEKRKEFLLKISQERPQLLHEIQCSPHSEEMLDKMVEEDLFKRALKIETLSSFDAMWLKHPRFEEIYKASRDKPEHQPQTGDSTGQSEQTIPMPESPEAKKILEKEYPVNKVSFRSGKLVLEPMSKDSIEQLSEKDKSIMILYSLLRNKKRSN
jgi:hypothetical protein